MKRWQRSLVAAASWLEDGSSASSEWGRPGWSRAGLTLIAAGLLAVPMSAAVRNLTGLPIEESLVVALLVALGVGVAALPLQERTGPRSPRLWIFPLAFVVVAFGYAFSELYNPFFGGFPAMIGADGGNHLRNQLAFVARGTHYVGMDALYATTYWLETAFGIDAFASFRAAFYSVVLATVLFMAMASVALASRHGRGATSPVGVSFVLVVALGYFPATYFLLPLLHYYQGDGYFSQLFGLIPVLLAILLYGTARRRVSRILALGFCVLFARYTYLLNLADLVATASFLIAWEAASSNLPRSRRRLLGVVAALGVAVAIYLYARIYEILPEPGGFRPSATILAAVGTLVLSGVLIVVPRLLRDTRLAVPTAGIRIFTFSGVFGLISVTVQFLWRTTQQDPGTYYYYKYGFSAVVVTSLAAIVLVAHALAGLGVEWRSPRGLRRRPGVVVSTALAATLLGFGLLSKAHVVYLPSYAERSDGVPPWRQLDPLADRRAWRMIDDVLRQTGYRFGGMITPRWPESSFTNGRFGLPHDPIYWKGELDGRGGRCVFWYKSGHPLPRAFGGSTPRVRKVVEALEAHPERRCDRYSPDHVPGRVGILCHVCYRDGESHQAGGTGRALEPLPAEGT
jgi:hypothetical protein